MHICPNLINYQIQVLKDFGVLAKKQEAAVRSILASCKSDIQMEQKLHNVLYGVETIQNLIDRELN